MPRTGKVTVSVICALAVCGLSLALWLLPPSQRVFRAIVKLEAMRIPYAISFFIGLFLLVLLLIRLARAWHPAWVFVGSVLLVQVVSTLSLTIANLFITRGLDRTLRTIEEIGLLDVVFMDFIAAMVIGTWLAGLLVAIAIMISRASPSSQDASRQ